MLKVNDYKVSKICGNRKRPLFISFIPASMGVKKKLKHQTIRLVSLNHSVIIHVESRSIFHDHVTDCSLLAAKGESLSSWCTQHRELKEQISIPV